mgnify:CR=1 FL=1
MGRKCFGVKQNGGILLPPTCEINYDNMQPNMLTCDFFLSTCELILLACDLNVACQDNKVANWYK